MLWILKRLPGPLENKQAHCVTDPAIDCAVDSGQTHLKGSVSEKQSMYKICASFCFFCFDSCCFGYKLKKSLFLYELQIKFDLTD